MNNLLKEFEFFCKISRGKFHIELFPICRKLDYSIILEYEMEENNKFKYIRIKIKSDKGDFDIFKIHNLEIKDVSRDVEVDENNTLSYYTLSIETNKGTIKIKRSYREDKIIFEFNGNDIKYSSSVIF